MLSGAHRNYSEIQDRRQRDEGNITSNIWIWRKSTKICRRLLEYYYEVRSYNRENFFNANNFS